MGSQAAIEKLLLKASVGDRRPVSELLRLLSKAQLFAPVLRMQLVGGSAEASRVVLKTINELGRKFVPAYLSSEDVSRFCGAQVEQLSLLGADLGLSLPPGTGLWLNYGSEYSIRLMPREVKRMDEFDELELEDEASKLLAIVNNAQEALKATCEGYGEIREAYYIPGSDPGAGGVFGLRASELTADRRFRLIESVATVSKELFGLAGAIEVYDDLGKVVSGSLTVFDEQVPFFVRDEQRQ